MATQHATFALEGPYGVGFATRDPSRSQLGLLEDQPRPRFHSQWCSSGHAAEHHVCRIEDEGLVSSSDGGFEGDGRTSVLRLN